MLHFIQKSKSQSQKEVKRHRIQFALTISKNLGSEVVCRCSVFYQVQISAAVTRKL